MGRVRSHQARSETLFECPYNSLSPILGLPGPMCDEVGVSLKKLDLSTDYAENASARKAMRAA